jgi:hypothetical protein
MIGALGNIGRIVGRETMEEIIGRIMAGRSVEDLLTREEIARRVGQKSFDLLVDKIKKEMKRREDERIEEDDRNKEILECQNERFC